MPQRIQIDKDPEFIRRTGQPSDLCAEDRWEQLPLELHHFAPRRLSYTITDDKAVREEEYFGPIHSEPLEVINDWCLHSP